MRKEKFGSPPRGVGHDDENLDLKEQNISNYPTLRLQFYEAPSPLPSLSPAYTVTRKINKKHTTPQQVARSDRPISHARFPWIAPRPLFVRASHIPRIQH